MKKSTEILVDLKRIEEQKSSPENWVERIMSSMKIKKKQLAMVHPCIINGQHTLVYEHGLAQKDPASLPADQSILPMRRAIC